MQVPKCYNDSLLHVLFNHMINIINITIMRPLNYGKMRHFNLVEVYTTWSLHFTKVVNLSDHINNLQTMIGTLYNTWKYTRPQSDKPLTSFYYCTILCSGSNVREYCFCLSVRQLLTLTFPITFELLDKHHICQYTPEMTTSFHMRPPWMTLWPLLWPFLLRLAFFRLCCHQGQHILFSQINTFWVDNDENSNDFCWITNFFAELNR